MDAMALSILCFIGLVVFSGAPLVVGILGARINARFRGRPGRDATFWAIVGSYLGLLALLGLLLIATVSSPQQEGLGAFSASFVMGLGGLPGSILPLMMALGVDQGTLPRPFGLGSMSTWFVIGTLCWQFFLIVGVRWLVQVPSRKRGGVPIAPVEQSPSEVLARR
jgi:hypothetical protein